MIDSLLTFQDQADRSPVLQKLGLRNPASVAGSANSIQPYALLTLHRPSNVDHRETFSSILEGLSDLAKTCPIIFSAHPRTRKRVSEFGLEHFFNSMETNKQSDGAKSVSQRIGIRLLEPQGYLDFLCLMKNAALVVTDSGGIQEETTCLGVPCVTVRENTERPITVTQGTNIIAGTDKEKNQGSYHVPEDSPQKRHRTPRSGTAKQVLGSSRPSSRNSKEKDWPQI